MNFSVDEFLEKNLYDKRDVDRVKTNDQYARSFIRDYETLEIAAERIHETLKWRKESIINGMVIPYNTNVINSSLIHLFKYIIIRCYK